MTAVFADTSFYVAACNPRDTFHQAAVDFAQKFRGTLLTTEFVLLELGNWLSRTGDRAVFVGLIERVKADLDSRVVPAEHSLFERGYALFAGRPDKNWSLTDCISFVVMQEEEITEALTADHHFAQAGFTILLK